MEFSAYQEQVCTSIAEFRRERHSVKPETAINVGFGSLGVEGDDTVDLLNHLRARFGTSFERFPYDRYFGPDSLPPGAIITYSWQRLTGASKPLEKITAGDLALYMWNEKKTSET